MVHKIIEVGKSKAVVIPKDILAQAGLKKGSRVDVTYDPDNGIVILKPVTKDGESDPKFVRSLKRGSKRYKKVLQELAKTDSARETSRGIRESGAWKVRLFNFVDAFRRNPRAGLAEDAPVPGTDAGTLALLASTVERLCAQARVPIPWWCAGVPALPEPWFVAGIESLKASALVESPPEFRKRNIFVLGNFLDRV